MAGKVSRRCGSQQTDTPGPPSWFKMALFWFSPVAMVTEASGKAARSWRSSRWAIDSYSPASFWNSFKNCLERTSLESGQSRLPLPPDKRIRFISGYLSARMGLLRKSS